MSGRTLHPATEDLVDRFAVALKEKLLAAQGKYSYAVGWADSDWMDECREALLEHIAKGDPRDIAAYCAFLWHHGESTAALATPQGEPATLLFEHEDGRYLVAVAGSRAIAGDPQWHRIGPVQVELGKRADPATVA